MNKLVAAGVMAIALVLVVSICGCVQQQTSTPSNETGKVQEKISNVTTKISNLTKNSSIGPINIGPLNLTSG